ncbi:MAG: murein peptide amidase A [Cyanobacteria bacterium]|nr:murein peptide amidase A [Cyanobacteriota bacterium]
MNMPAYEEITLGYSVEGRPIVATRFLPGVSEVDTLFLAAFHGDEPLSEQLLSRWRQHLINNPAEWAHSPAFILVPVVNPDGLHRQTRTNARGVDLNRNFPTQNWAEIETGTPYYSGPQAASEPETEALLALLEATKPRKIISLHTPYKVLNFDGPAEALANAMASHCGYPVVADIGYPTPGSFGTYVGKERGIPTVTVELAEDVSLDTLWKEHQLALEAALLFTAAGPVG